MDELFHLFSDGSKSSDLHLNNDDYIATLNRIAVTSYFTGFRPIAFSAQDTHLHILGRGLRECCCEYVRRFTRSTRFYLQGRDNAEFTLEMLAVDNPDYAKNVGTYVICQATKDGKKVLPYDYVWSSASLYFRKGRNDLLWILDEDGNKKEIRHMRNIPIREQRKLFRTREPLPDEWRICGGLILPSSYIDVRSFESIYHSHNAFRVFCGNGVNKDRQVLDNIMNTFGVSLDEDEARAVAAEQCMNLFGTKGIKSLRTDQRIAIARELRRNYNISFAQLARRVYLPEAEIRRYLP